MAVRDEQVEWLRVELYRRMTPQQRMRIAARLFEDGISIVRSSILDRHPDIDPHELHCQIRRRVLPSGLADRVEAAIGKSVSITPRLKPGACGATHRPD
jgi:hypothetical protein